MKTYVEKTSKIGLNWLGKTITHRISGEGIVVGYSPITGEPFVYFYSGEFRYTVCCISHKSVISVAESSPPLQSL